MTETSYFQSLVSGHYWSGTEYSAGRAWDFNLTYGSQGDFDKSSSANAIAVRVGDVAVAPEPISYVLFLTGGAMLGFRRFRKKIKN